VVPSSGSGEKPSGGILDGLNFADKALGQAVQQFSLYTPYNLLIDCRISKKYGTSRDLVH